MLRPAPERAPLAVYASTTAAAALLFGIGVLGSRWTRRHCLPSGLEIRLLGACAGIAGYSSGALLPGLLRIAGVAG